jgi:hypothetical protein
MSYSDLPAPLEVNVMAHRLRRAVFVSVLACAVACGGTNSPTEPSQPPLPLAAETTSYRYYYVSGDRVDPDWQESYHAWATARLGVQLPQKIQYYKYQSRQDMGNRTGNYNTNGYAEPARFEIHTLWPTDNHEVVHIYTALVGRPSDFFNEGIAVAFQTNPTTGDFESRFNGAQVHDACAAYLRAGTLVLPLERIVVTDGFRSVSDSVLSYREAGSFVRFMIDTYGLDRTLEFFRRSSRNDSASVVRGHFLNALGVSLETAEGAWLDMLRAR